MRARAMESVRRTAAPMGAALVIVLAAGCGGEGPGPTGGTAPAPQAGTLTPRPSRSSHDLNGSPQCTGSDVHQKHLSKFSCATCHSSGGAYGFTNPNVFPRGTTTAGGVLVLRTDTTPTTCTVACHYPMGGSPKSITWNTPGPLACTDCHSATNLPSTHPAISPTATASDCLGCHQTTTHLTGTVTLVGHDTAWTTQTSPGFHAFSAVQGLAQCQQCHGQDLGGGLTGFSCAQCHDQRDASGNVIAWKTNCTMCHGGTDNQTGAPPAAIWGQAGDPNRGSGVADPVRVGAHTAHVTGGALAPPFDCGICHVKPADALAAGHIDTVTSGSVPLASVTFSGMAIQSLQQGVVPAWDRTTATCSNTYCHGATVGGGTLKSPVWTTVDGSQAACGTCHGVPPPSPHASIDVTAGLSVCNPCHSDTIDPNGAVIPPSAGGKHLDGTVEATGHGDSWMDTTSAGFHAYSADSNIASCQACHGANLDGVGGMTTVACGQCHDTALPVGVTSWKTNCVMCHGGTDNQTGAPPKAKWGNTDPIAIGAHTSHVAATHAVSLPLDCVSCHVKPADALAAGHVDGAATVTGYTGTDAALLAAVKDPGWNRTAGTCATAYCHGATLQGGTLSTPTWTTLDGTQAACGTCHGLPPPTGRLSQIHYQGDWYPLHVLHVMFGYSCGSCHPGYPADNGSTNKAIHVNGMVEVGNNVATWNSVAGSCLTRCHGITTWMQWR